MRRCSRGCATRCVRFRRNLGDIDQSGLDPTKSGSCRARASSRKVRSNWPDFGGPAKLGRFRPVSDKSGRFGPDQYDFDHGRRATAKSGGGGVEAVPRLRKKIGCRPNLGSIGPIWANPAKLWRFRPALGDVGQFWRLQASPGRVRRTSNDASRLSAMSRPRLNEGRPHAAIQIRAASAHISTKLRAIGHVMASFRGLVRARCRVGLESVRGRCRSDLESARGSMRDRSRAIWARSGVDPRPIRVLRARSRARPGRDERLGRRCISCVTSFSCSLIRSGSLCLALFLRPIGMLAAHGLPCARLECGGRCMAASPCSCFGPSDWQVFRSLTFLPGSRDTPYISSRSPSAGPWAALAGIVGRCRMGRTQI